MLISTRGRYALRVMIDLADHGDGTFIPLKAIAARQDISEKYLESIAAALSKGGLIEGLRGKGGGYRLTCAPEACTVGAVLKLTDGALTPVACLEQPVNTCARAARCKTLPMWSALDTLLDQFFESITVADLAAGRIPESVR